MSNHSQIKNMNYVFLMLLPIIFMSTYYYGIRVLFMCAFSIILVAIFNYICLKFNSKKTLNKNYRSSYITGFIIVLCLPATTPYWIIFIAIFIAIFIVKYSFGGYGKNIFNPAAVGIAFCVISFNDVILKYPKPFSQIPFWGDINTEVFPSPYSILNIGGAPKITFMNGLLGNFEGPAGATCMLILGIIAIILLLKKVVPWQIFFSTMITTSLISVIFPRVLTGRYQSFLFETISGVLFFGVIFMASDPVTISKTSKGKIIFGFLLGILTMVFRHFSAGDVEYGFVFALLLMNAVADKCDDGALYLSQKTKKLYEFIKNKINSTVTNKSLKEDLNKEEVTPNA